MTVIISELWKHLLDSRVACQLAVANQALSLPLSK